jgi:hypothetical protein
VPCPTAHILFQDYAKATIEYFEATDKLSGLVGQHEDFAEHKMLTDQTHAKCHATRQALERHWEEHGCRVSDPTPNKPAEGTR